MPRNFKEAMLFTVMMCGIMVFGMSTWNIYINTGQVHWNHIFVGYLPGFLVAFLLDVVLVGPIAKKIAFSILHHTGHHEKRWVKILAISGTMALFMVAFMSLYGLIFNLVIGQGLPWSVITWGAYGKVWLTNFVAAIPLNFLIAGPISRFILGRLQKPLPGDDKVEDFDDDDEMPVII